MTDPSFGAPAQPAPTNRNRNLILIAVAALLLLCCCCLVILVPIAWSCGDVLTGISTQCAPLFGP
jgi:hypothetical protein